MIFNVSGGGTALNFRVVGGTTAPANPAENCIWVNTDNPITSWLFSATEPSPAEAGMVWITIGSSSSVSFDALKKNGIQVYPISAKQYVSGAWVDKTAKIYQGGEWVTWWTKYLYNRGDQCELYTGGWKATYETGYTPIQPGFNSDHIYMATTSTQGIMVTTKNKVSLAGITTLKINLTDTKTNGGQHSKFCLFITSAIDPVYSGSEVASVWFTGNTANLDVTRFNEEYYVIWSGGLNVSGKLVELTWEQG